MGYEIVDTPSATFVVILQAHGTGALRRRMKLPDIKMDAIVTEGVFPRYFASSTIRPTINQLSIFDKQNNGSIGIFNADAMTENVSLKRSLLRTTAVAFPIVQLFGTIPIYSLLIPYAALEFSGEIKKRKLLGKAAAATSNLFFGPQIVSQRDAIVADKSISQIAPLIQSRVHRKPVIGITYGTGHYGIVEMLRNPNKRRHELASISPKSRASFGIYEYRISNNKTEWKVTKVSEINPALIPTTKRLRAKWRLTRIRVKKVFEQVRKKFLR